MQLYYINWYPKGMLYAIPSTSFVNMKVVDMIIFSCVIFQVVLCIDGGRTTKPNCPQLIGMVGQGNISGIKELLKTCDVDSRSADNRTALHRAVGLGRPDVVFVLLDRGADPRRPDPRGLTPLHLAANSTHAADAVETVAHLLLGNARRLARDDRGRIPLHFAARRNSLSAARLLLTACNPACRLAQLRCRDRSLRRPAEHGNSTVAAWMIDVSREAVVAWLGSMRGGLRENFFNKPNCPDLPGNYGNPTNMKVLLRRCNLNSINSDTRSVLQMACWHSPADVVFKLLSYGADVNYLNKYSQDPLVYATYNPKKNSPEIVAMILLHNPGKLQTQHRGLIPLHFAAEKNSLSKARLLLGNCNADCKLRQLRSRNHALQTPRDMAPKGSDLSVWLNEVSHEAVEELTSEISDSNQSTDKEWDPWEASSQSQDRVRRMESHVRKLSRQLDRLLADRRGENSAVGVGSADPLRHLEAQIAKVGRRLNHKNLPSVESDTPPPTHLS